MKVEYCQLFLKDLKKLKKQPVYEQVFDLAFEILPNAEDLKNLSNRDLLHQEYQVPLDKIHIIPGGVDIDRFNINRLLKKSNSFIKVL